MEKYREYNRPRTMAFVYYDKAFVSVENWTMFDAFHHYLIDSQTNLEKHVSYIDPSENRTNDLPIKRTQ